MDEEFFLEDVEDEIDEEEDLALGAAEDDIVFGEEEDHDNDIQIEVSKKQLDFISEVKKDNKPTQRMTKMAMKVFFQFLCTNGIEINIGTCSKQELAGVLKRFFLKVRKSDGEMYKKNALGSIKFGLIRGIKEVRKDFNFAYDSEFRVAVQAFKHAMRQLRFLGKTVDHLEKISMDDLEKLYSSDVFDVNRPTSLQNKVIFEISFFLICSRGRKNLRNLKPGNFAIKFNERGRKYVQIVDSVEKLNESFDNQQAGGLLETAEGSNGTRPKGCCIFELPGNPKCPVAAIEKYLSKLQPQSACFFPQPADRPRFGKFLEYDVWYSNAALGKNTLGASMRELSKQAELSRTYSNFCIHATGVSILNSKGYDVKNYLDNKDVVGGCSRSVSITNELEMMERMSDVLSKVIIPTEVELKDSSTGLHEDIRRDVRHNDPDCKMYLVPMQDIPEDQETHAPADCITTQGQSVQVLTVPPASYAPQNSTPQVFFQPHTQFKNTVRIQPLGTRSLLQNKIQTIAPKESACSATVPQHSVQAIAMPQNTLQAIAVPQNSLQTVVVHQTPMQAVAMPQNSMQAITMPQNSFQATNVQEAAQIIIKTEPSFSHSTCETSSSPSTMVSSGVLGSFGTPGTVSSIVTPETPIDAHSVIQAGVAHEMCQSTPVHVSTFSNDSQTPRREPKPTDNSTKQTNQSINSILQIELKQKDQVLQQTNKRVSQLELYQGEYKRLLQESTILQQHLSNNQAKIKELTSKIENLKKQNAEESKNSFSFDQICCNRTLFKHYTGYTPEEFQMLFQFLIQDTNNGPYKGKGHTLSLRSQLVLTLSKFKNNFSFIDLGQRYHVSKVTARNMFCAWICHMSDKFEDVYVWPHRETLKVQVPRYFQQDFQSTLAIFKRVKVKVSRAYCNKENRKDSCGNSRHAIVAVDPRGCILGCSGLVSGILTDSELFVKSGFKSQMMKLIETGRLQKDDGILSENLNIESDLTELGLKLNDVSYSKCDIDDDLKSVLQKQRVETHKIIIDKAVCRLKRFQLISQVIPTTLSSSSDKILQVAAFLTNFMPPLSLDVS